MRSFDEILDLAAERKGGLGAVEALLAETPSRTPEEIAALTDDRILAEMTRRIFNAGFSSKVIAAKWPAFERAFQGFDPHACAFMSDEQLDALLGDRDIVRNAVKIRTVRANAAFILELAREHGSASRFLADWPDSNLVGLLNSLKKRGSHLGGDSGMRFLRAIGKPAFVTTKDVIAALVREGIVAKPPSSKGDFKAVQDAFNEWSAASGRNLTDISRVLAMSIGS
ncbi:3-methyl-adenine DNA glycosylase I [Hartmannibacter diazotrophicus]|uniref:3-methyl-adenine DNA glycosylase I n=1 Tax=Hartmannibacter diazotrophicus TaxID=1482074 RepID=A0A2C9D872_9HYPH|nr:DNA-3-methyladenine glycosylase I [Hartmannibacter diazotrophicus]SON55941.1 3-methyl-adenine DNA glycosylase I [Hartmannibacter diazotrophicus]